MNEHARRVLVQVIKQHGKTIAEDGRPCKRLFNDSLLNEHRNEVSDLVHAVEAKVVCNLLSNVVPLQALFPRLIRQLRDEKGTGEIEAKWAVESWAFAFGVMTDQQASALDAEEMKQERLVKEPNRSETTRSSPTEKRAAREP